MDSALQITVLLLATCSIHVAAYPNGTVVSSCSTMQPGHGTSAQTSPSPYSLSVSNTTYGDGQSITVTLRNTSLVPPFEGFLIQARAMDGGITPLGTFQVSNDTAQTLKCGTANSAVSHISSDKKTFIQVTWTGPKVKSSSYEIRATVVQNKTIYWMNVTSSKITYSGSEGFRLLAPALNQLLLGTSTLILALLAV